MNRFNKPLLLAGLLLMIGTPGCDKSGEGMKTMVLHFIADGSTLNTVDSDDWIIVSDKDGNLIGYRSFEDHDEFQIESTSRNLGDIIGVTVLHHQQYQAFDTYLLTTRLGFRIGQTLRYTAPALPESAGVPTGSFQVTVTDVPDLTDIRQGIVSSKGGTGCDATNDGGSTLNFECNTYGDVGEKLVTVEDNAGKTKYAWIDNVEPGGSYSIPYSELSDPDTTVKFNFPATENIYMLIDGQKDEPETFGPGYNVFFDAPAAGGSFQAPYLKDLSFYYTNLSLRYEGYDLTYSSYGSIPDGKVEWPKPSDYSISDTTIENFAAASAEHYELRVSEWVYFQASPHVQVRWYVHSPLGSQSIKELPEEILKKYPALSLANMNYSSTAFYTKYSGQTGFDERDPAEGVGINIYK